LDADTYTARRQFTQANELRAELQQRDHPLPGWPMTNEVSEHGCDARMSERAEGRAPDFGSEARRRETKAEVAQLTEALRAARRAHARYVAELRQGDVEPAEDWATWYAEYLLGER
jgi:hypothetical protein